MQILQIFDHLPLFTLVDIWTTTYLPVNVDKFLPYIDMYLVLLNHQAGTTYLELQGKLKTFVLQKYKVEIKEFPWV